jgi:uncharacterized membrane protein YdbT with pleckstrin-like domain
MIQSMRGDETRRGVNISKARSGAAGADLVGAGRIPNSRQLSGRRAQPAVFTSGQGVENVDLKKLFPCSSRKPLRLSFKQFLSFAFIVVVCVLCDHYLVSVVESETVRNAIQSAMLAFISLSGINWLVAYWLVKFRGRALKYFIRDGSLVITKGIFLKKSGSFHLSHITDVYLVQEQLDWIFRTCNLCVSTANQSSGQFAFIEGFSEETAQNLQEYLLKQAEASAAMVHSNSHNSNRNEQFLA